jgi:hypothetical protein
MSYIDTKRIDSPKIENHKVNPAIRNSMNTSGQPNPRLTIAEIVLDYFYDMGETIVECRAGLLTAEKHVNLNYLYSMLVIGESVDGNKWHIKFNKNDTRMIKILNELYDVKYPVRQYSDFFNIVRDAWLKELKAERFSDFAKSYVPFFEWVTDTTVLAALELIDIPKDFGPFNTRGFARLLEEKHTDTTFAWNLQNLYKRYNRQAREFSKETPANS